MGEKSVEPLIAAARSLELFARRALVEQSLNLVVAQPTRRALHKQKLPSAWRDSARQLRGPRIERKGSPERGLVSTALWPQDGLEAKRLAALCGVLQGEAALTLADYCLHVPAENMVFIPAGVPHPDGSQPHLSSESRTDSCDIFWLYRWEGGLICHICHSRGNLHANFQADENCFLIGEQSILYFDLLAEAISEQQKSETPVNAFSDFIALPYLLPALLAVVATDLQAGRFVQPGVRLAGASDSSEATDVDFGQSRQSAKWRENLGAIAHAQTYLTFHLDQPLCIDDMAQMACMSRAQFTQLFRRVAGKSFVQYLTGARLERAKLLLRETDWSVEVIARAVGWRSAHLWKMFARELNTTPGEFRRAGKENSSSRKK